MMAGMTDEELRRALDGLFAYDSGSTDSGIHDEDLRARCIAEMQARTGPLSVSPDPFLARMLRDMWLSEEALAQGYGTEAALRFIDWLDERMDFAIR
jgi:hypothetical protein